MGRKSQQSLASRRTEPPRKHLPVLRPIYSAALLFLSVLLIALPTVGSRLVLYDDAIYLGRPAVTGGISWSGFLFAFTSVSDLDWHPLTWLSHEVNISLFGMTPAGRHSEPINLSSVAEVRVRTLV